MMVAGIRLSYELLIGEGIFSGQSQTGVFTPSCVELIREIILRAWEQVDSEAELKGSFTKIFQAASEPYSEFLGKLKDVILRPSKSKEKNP